MKSQCNSKMLARRKLSKFIINVNLSIKKATDKALLESLSNEENENLINLLEILSRIEYNYQSINKNYITPNNVTMINNTLTADGRIKLNYSTSNEAKISIITQYFKYNKFQAVFNNLFVMDVLEENDNKDKKEVEESTFSFKLNCEMKAQAGKENRHSSVYGYIIGDDTGFTSKTLTNFLCTKDESQFGVMFPGVVSKRLTSPEVIEYIVSLLNTHEDGMILQTLVRMGKEEVNNTIDELNSLVILILLGLIKKENSPIENHEAIISTHLCAVHTSTSTKVFGVGTITGNIDLSLRYKNIKGTIGYNKLLREINEKCINKRETAKFYANEINNSKAMTKLLIEVIEDFYLYI